jgi:formamidopyrimidine-DNA glycosylase
VPGVEGLGVDVLSADFTLERFRAVAKKRRDQVKSFLLDHAALDTLGNAYSDEVMWAARIHPRTRVTELSPDQIAALHQAIVGVLRSAVDEIARRKPATDEKLRDFLSVRNKKGQPCPRCGTAIRTCGVHGHDAFFCPTCQPDAQGRGFVDWRRIKGA